MHRYISAGYCFINIPNLKLLQYGVNLKRQEYYSDSPVEGTGIGTERKAEDAL
jgi:hypothetical protein